MPAHGPACLRGGQAIELLAGRKLGGAGSSRGSGAHRGRSLGVARARWCAQRAGRLPTTAGPSLVACRLPRRSFQCVARVAMHAEATAAKNDMRIHWESWVDGCLQVSSCRRRRSHAEGPPRARVCPLPAIRQRAAATAWRCRQQAASQAAQRRQEADPMRRAAAATCARHVLGSLERAGVVTATTLPTPAADTVARHMQGRGITHQTQPCRRP